MTRTVLAVACVVIGTALTVIGSTVLWGAEALIVSGVIIAVAGLFLIPVEDAVEPRTAPPQRP